MSRHREDAGAGRQRPVSDPSTTTVQARTATQPLTSGLESTMVTAEIPVAPPPPPRSRRERESHSRAETFEELLPAPVGVRLLVWVLFFVFLIALIALAVEHFHPDWLSFLHNSAATTSLRRVTRSTFAVAR